MIIKGTQIFTHTSRVSDPASPIHRIGGWTESYYWEGATIEQFRNEFLGGPNPAGGVWLGLSLLRARLLPTGANIVGQRYQQVNPVGPSQSLGRLFAGSAGILNDVPQMTLLCDAPGVGVKNVRRLFLRGMPDVRVTEGEFDAPAGYISALQDFFDFLAKFSFRARDLNQPQIPVVSITSGGVVTSSAAVPFLQNSFVQIGRAKTATGGNVTGVFQVDSVGPGFGVFQLKNWTLGSTTGGYARGYAIIYPKFDAPSVHFNRIVVKKIGRPFTQYRGRRSKRRK